MIELELLQQSLATMTMFINVYRLLRRLKNQQIKWLEDLVLIR